MLRSMIKLAAYSLAPRATFAVTHPRKAAQLKKLRWDMQHAPAPRYAAVSAALGAAAVALPLGIALGRLGARRHNGASNGHAGLETEGPAADAMHRSGGRWRHGLE